MIGKLLANIFKTTATDLVQGTDRHGGLSRSNRFAVFMTTPRYSFFNTNISSVLYGIKDGFTPEAFFDDPRDIAILCESLSIPASRLNTIDYRDVRHTQKMPVSFTNDDVDMEFIVTNDHYAPRMFKLWENSIVNRETHRFKYRDTYVRDVYIVGMDVSGFPNYFCRLQDAFPVSISSIPFDNKKSDDVNRVTVSFTYKDWKEIGVEDVLGAIDGIGSLELPTGFTGEGGILQGSLNEVSNQLPRLSSAFTTGTEYVNKYSGQAADVVSTGFKDIIGDFGF